MFTQSAGSRPVASKVAVLFVEGQFMNEADTIREAILARQSGIAILVVGIDPSNTQLPQWLGVASFPAEFNVFNVADYSLLPTIVGRLITSIGNGKSIAHRLF